MASNKKKYNRPQIDTKSIAEKKEKRKALIFRVLAVCLAGLMILGVGASAIASMLI